MKGRDLADVIVDVIVEKKGSNIVLLNVSEQTIVADYFLFCSGDNVRQLKAIADDIKQTTKKDAGVHVTRIEGEAETGWILLDYDDLLVHVFSPEKREYYDLEELWHEGHTVLRIP